MYPKRLNRNWRKSKRAQTCLDYDKAAWLPFKWRNKIIPGTS